MRKSGYPTLLALMKHLQATKPADEHSVTLSKDGLRVVGSVDGQPLSDSLALQLDPLVVRSSPGASGHNTSGNRTAPHSTMMVADIQENLWEIYEFAMPDEFRAPEAPTSAEMSKSEKRIHEKVGVGHAGVFTGDMLTPYVPTYFVPMAELEQALPTGYTTDHIERLFTATSIVEVVRLDGHAFVRMHGGSTVDLSRSPEANARFPQYEPDPSLADMFVPLFERPYKWYPLRQIVLAVPEAVRFRLPFAKYQSLLYFAQMQHRFNFSPDGEGEVCMVDGTDQLAPHTTPTPLALSAVMRVLEECGGAVGLSEVIDSMSRHALVQLVLYFRCMEDFVVAHSSVLVYCPVHRTAELKSHAETRQRHNRTLEEKLEDALKSNEKRDVRKIRRRIATLRNPNNPLLDRNRLVEEVKKFLPQKRSIAFRTLMRNMPPDIVDLFPSDQISLFRTSPQHFQVFEYKSKGRLHISRAELPLPPGHLRTSYTDEELLHMCASHLSHHPRLVVDVFSRLPWGARELVRTKHKGLFHFVTKYPQYFAVVFKDGKQKYDSRAAVLSLVGQPPVMEVDAALLVDSPVSPVVEEDDDAANEVAQIAKSLGYTAAVGGTDRDVDDAADNAHDEGKLFFTADA